VPNPLFTLRYAVVPTGDYDNMEAEFTLTTVSQGDAMGYARERARATGRQQSVVKIVEVAVYGADLVSPTPHVVPSDAG